MESKSRCMVWSLIMRPLLDRSAQKAVALSIWSLKWASSSSSEAQVRVIVSALFISCGEQNGCAQDRLSIGIIAVIECGVPLKKSLNMKGIFSR